MGSTDDTWLSVPDAARRIGVSTRTIHRWIAAGIVTGQRVGPRLLRVNLASLDGQLTTVGAEEMPHG